MRSLALLCTVILYAVIAFASWRTAQAKEPPASGGGSERSRRDTVAKAKPAMPARPSGRVRTQPQTPAERKKETAAANPPDAAAVARAGLIAAVQAALKSGDSAKARSLLEQAYLTAPQPALLLQLGMVAEAENRPIAAADYYHRYLADVGDRVDAAVVSRLQEQMGQLTQPRAEVSVDADYPGALLYCDGDLLGALPLAAPLWLTPGSHLIKLQRGPQILTPPAIQFRAGPLAVLRLNMVTSSADLVAAPVALFLFDVAFGPSPMPKEVRQAAERAAQQRHTQLVTLADVAAELERAGPLDRNTLRKQVQAQVAVAKRLSAAYVMTVHILPSVSQAFLLSGQLVDVQSGALAQSAEEENLPLQPDAVPAIVGRLTERLLRGARFLARGQLVLRSIPDGAEVSLDGRVIGHTPLTQSVLAGRHDVVMSKPGCLPSEGNVEVAADQERELDLRLSLLSPPARQDTGDTERPPERARPGDGKRRPRWRLIAGPLAMAGGALLLGFGASALGAHGHCLDTPMPPRQVCNRVLDTQAVGGGLLGTGIAVVLGGLTLLAWP